MPTAPVTRLVSMGLRVGELAFAAVVAGIIGKYLHAFDKANSWPQARFIFTEVIAGLSMLFALVWLIPFASGFVHWPVDLVLFAAWMAAFGLLVNFIGPMNCGSIWHWGDITDKGTCERWKAAVAFAFLSSMFWLASTLLGLWFMHKARKGQPVAMDGTAGKQRRTWYRRNRSHI